MNAARIRAGCFLLALSLLLAVAFGASGQTSSPWVYGPMLGAVGDDVIVISWETSRQVSVDLHYASTEVREASGSWSETLTFDRQEGHAEIWLRDLSSATEYQYQLIAYDGDAVYPSKLGSFRTSGPDVRAFTFVIYGHTRSFPDRHKLVADTIARDEAGAAFAAHVGELAEALTSDRLDNFRWATASLSRSIPYVTVVGSETMDLAAYCAAFALPQGGGSSGEQWWAFDYGDMLLLGLDSTLSDPTNPQTQEQLAWLRQTLSATDPALSAVFCSAPLYGSGYPAGRNESLITLWEPIFVEHGVDLVVCGETGAYEHAYVRGIHHVMAGGGGGPLSDPPEERPTGLVFSRYGVLHYLRVTVADGALRVEAVPVASIIDDEVYLTPSDNAIDAFVLR